MPEDYRILAELRGFKWLGPEVSNNQTKTGWKCPKGHDWLATYNTIQQGNGCPHCIRKLPEDYHELAESRSFKWLGPEAKSVNIKTTWGCSQGHKWEAVYANISYGYGCPDCKRQKLSLQRLKKPADYHALAKSRGFKWIGPKVKGVTVKTKWECSQGHKWEVGYNSIQGGNGCPHCGNASSAHKRKKKPEDYRVLAKKRGIIWLGPEVKNNQTKTKWQCPKGHTWETGYNNILSGRGCPECAIQDRANKKRKKPGDYHALATERGFEWLGPEVKDAHAKTKWKCTKGHEWEANYNAIQQKTGCPYCAGLAPKFPEDFHEIAKIHDLIWLGPEVPKINMKTKWQCPKGHIWKAPYNRIQQGRGCKKCATEIHAEKRRTKPDKYHKLAKTRGFKWLGDKVINNNAKTKWQCELGHKWHAPYSSIQQGYGCPYCSGNAPKKPEDYHQLAKDRGFEWLGPEASTTNNRMTYWQCSENHKWRTSYGHISQGKGCPYCAGNAPKKIDDYYALAKEKKIKWTGKELPPNTITRTDWACKIGHKWELSYSNVRNGQGCPYCIRPSSGEEVIANLLKKFGYNYHRQFSFNECHSKKGYHLYFDFLVIFSSDHQGLIEFDGEQHLRPIDYFGGEESFQRIVENDSIKNQFALDYNIPLLRVPWGDLDNAEQILLDWIDSIQGKAVRINKKPKGANELYKKGKGWKTVTQLTLFDI